MECKEIQSSKLKIAMIGHKQIPSREGGIEIVVGELATRMAEQGNDITVYNRKIRHVSDKNMKVVKNENLEYKGVKIISVPTIDKRGLAAISSSFFATLKAIFGHYDCIHYHAEGPSVMLIIPHLLKIRTVVTIHGLDWSRAKWGGFAVKYLKLGEKIAAKYADEIIVLSKNVQKYFKNTYERDTVYISNGIEKPKKIKAEIITKKWGLIKNEYILFLGRIVPEKGLDYLIKAYKKVKSNKKLIIAGGSSDTDEFLKAIKESAKDDSRIKFIGFVHGQELEELYSNSYMYCLPSDIEGMPISLLEAMSYGNCCLVSDIPECAEVVEDRGVTFEKGNIEDLREKMQSLCYNEKLVEEFKENASDFICSKYNWDDVVEQTVPLYR